MSKARTLADFISDGSEFADGTISVAEVSGAAPLASPTFTGTVTVNADAYFGDGNAIRMGDNSNGDLVIQHDGQDSKIIDRGEGDLLIQGSTNIRLQNFTGSQNYLVGTNNAGVTAYYNNSPKLQTAADGVDITGDVGATTATITGKTTTDELDLNAIAATISDTAVDIFVYDTRKDSDGGAWRKRTQHTSWYNETLNTSTRGSRKEFPAVAVIVVQDSEDGAVVIYDGDDPDMPLWMKFNSGNMLPPNTSPPTSVSALNGDIMLGFGNDGTTRGCGVIKFVSDTAYWWRSTTANFAGNYIGGGIINRNSSGSYDGSQPTRIVDNSVNDVAMTVLPNAPIDAATGLPVPTIAVATDGGVSVIKDDGTVVDLTCSQANYTKSKFVSFVGQKIFLGFEFENDYSRRVWGLKNIPSSDLVVTTDVNTKGNADYHFKDYNPAYLSDLYISSYIGLKYLNVIDVVGDGETIYPAGYSVGSKLSAITLEDDPSKGMVNFITSDYNTGWMNGDIKLATLSDTDATNVTGSELVTNGDFATSSDWVLNGATISGGVMAVGQSGGNGWAYQNASLTTGTTYVLTFDVTATSSGSVMVFRNDTGGSTSNGLKTYSAPAVGSYSFTFTATGSHVNFVVGGGDTATVSLDNISVRLAEEDRSVNGNGLQVFGTVTKSAVATGADLVAYSVGGASYNYLAQPVNDDLNFGTGDWSATMWAKTSGTSTRYLFSRFNSTAGVGFGAYINSSNGHLAYWFDNGPTTYTVSGNTSVRDGSWHCLTFVRRGGTIYIYIDGKLDASNNIGSSIDVTTDARLVVLNYENGEYAWQGEMSLFRISATAPSPEQIKKIYEDEKVLFQDGAQATLYGSSDAVTALAYDDSTNLLHVGTSAGRSVFQGLRRVDNTTTAVGAAISASNGLVADE